MKVIKDKIIGAYMLINNAPLYQVKDKLSVIRFLKAVKPIVSEFEEYKETCIEKLKPANYDTLIEQYSNGDKHALDDYSLEVKKAIIDYINEEVEVEFEPLSEDTICELCTEKMMSKDIVELMEIVGNG